MSRGPAHALSRHVAVDISSRAALYLRARSKSIDKTKSSALPTQTYSGQPQLGAQMSGKTAVIASMGFGKGPNKLSDYAKSNVAHGHSISGGVGQKQIAKVRKRVTSDSIHQTRNNAQNTQEDSVSPVRHIQKR